MAFSELDWGSGSGVTPGLPKEKPTGLPILPIPGEEVDVEPKPKPNGLGLVPEAGVPEPEESDSSFVGLGFTPKTPPANAEGVFEDELEKNGDVVAGAPKGEAGLGSVPLESIFEVSDELVSAKGLLLSATVDDDGAEANEKPDVDFATTVVSELALKLLAVVLD